MIINTFFMLLFLGGFSGIFSGVRREKILSFVFWIITGGILFYFIRNWYTENTDKAIFHWLKYQKLHIDINLSSLPKNYISIFPIFVISWITMFIAVFNSEEHKKIQLQGMILLNISAFIFLLTASNLIQLLIGSCMVTVIGFYIINDTEARQKYVFYNLLSDLALFAVFAVIYGSLGNLELSELVKYKKSVLHTHWSTFLLFIGIFLKSGLFMFHNQLLALSVLNFNRMLYILTASTPLSALVILIKLLPLLQASTYCIPMLQIIAVITIVWAVINSMVIDNIKERVVYWVMMFYGYIYTQLIQIQELYNQFPLLIISAYLLGLNIYLVYYASSYELHVSKMGSFIYSLRFTFLLLLAAVFVIIQTVLSHSVEMPYSNNLAFIVFLIISLGHSCHQIFLGKNNADEKVMALLKNPAWYLFTPAMLITGTLAFYNNSNSLQIFYIFIGFLLLIITYPFKRLQNLAEYETIQEEDYFEKLYNIIFIMPIKIIGRVLWLTVDFVLIEKTIINSLREGIAFLCKVAAFLNKSSIWMHLVLTLCGIGIMLLYYYMRG